MKYIQIKTKLTDIITIRDNSTGLARAIAQKYINKYFKKNHDLRNTLDDVVRQDDLNEKKED